MGSTEEALSTNESASNVIAKVTNGRKAMVVVNGRVDEIKTEILLDDCSPSSLISKRFYEKLQRARKSKQLESIEVKNQTPQNRCVCGH